MSGSKYGRDGRDTPGEIGPTCREPCEAVMSMAGETMRRTVTTEPLNALFSTRCLLPTLPLLRSRPSFKAQLSLLPQEPFSGFLTGQSPMTYVFCKGFTVRCLYFSVSLFEYCQPHSLIPVRTEVMSVLHSHCIPHSPTCCRA